MLFQPAPVFFGVLWVFLRLGLTRFGGPVAHLGYFRDEFVDKRQWLAEADYADMVARCQFMPGLAGGHPGGGLIDIQLLAYTQSVN